MADCANTALVPGTATLGGMPLERAAGLNSGAGQAGLLLGAPLAGGLLAVVDPATVVLIDAVTFATAAVLIGVLVPVSAQPDTGAVDGAARPRYLSQLAVGLRFVRADRLILALATMIAVTNLLDYALFSVLLPVWVRDRLGAVGALGLIIGAGGVGSLLGNLLGAWLGPRLPRRRTYAIGFLIGGAPLCMALAVSSTRWLPLAVAFVGRLGSGSINPILGAVSYERIPPALLARVMGVMKASAWVGIPFGPLLGGLLVEAAGRAPRRSGHEGHAKGPANGRW